jgi:hypothetical protein
MAAATTMKVDKKATIVHYAALFAMTMTMTMPTMMNGGNTMGGGN